MNGNSFEDIGGNMPALAVQQVAAAPSALANTDQSRAVAEAQAALVIAQARPRSERDARDRIIQACQRTSLAQVAVYAFPRGGQQVSGPSVRLAEAAARAWGNMNYGFRELNRAGGASEVEAFAWDLETNTKAIRQFAVRHTRDKRGGPVALTDERDIYEMIANQAQRRVRACILEIIPGDIIEDAVKQCEKTLSVAVAKNGESLGDVAKSMVAAYEKFGVTKAAIEKRLGHRIDSIQPAEVLRLREIYASIKDGFSTAVEWFEMDGIDDPTDHTADILKRAAQGQEEQQHPATSNGTRNKPTKAEMEQRRAETKAELEALGVFDAVATAMDEKGQGHWASWNTAQCSRALDIGREMAKAAIQEASNEADSGPKPSAKVAGQFEGQANGANADQTQFVDCPRDMARIGTKECDGCPDRPTCPEWQGEEAQA